MVRLAGTNAPLIRRALAVYNVIADDSGVPTWIDLVYLKKGTFTTALAELAGCTGHALGVAW